MTYLVVDASIAAGWLLDDELDPRAVSALTRLRQEEAIVPRIWHYEVRNALLVAERRKRISREGTAERLDSLRELSILTDHEANLQETLNLARAHGLSFYDALYLELAKRREAVLVTLDTGLTRAAVAEDLELG